MLVLGFGVGVLGFGVGFVVHAGFIFLGFGVGFIFRGFGVGLIMHGDSDDVGHSWTVKTA